MGKAMRAGRAKRWSKLAALPVGVLASGAMVLTATHATAGASAWNEGNQIGSGTWAKYDVTSSKPGQAVVNVKDLKPGQTGTAEVSYNFQANNHTSADRVFAGVLLKDFFAANGDGDRAIEDVADSELAKHLHLKIRVHEGAQDQGVTKSYTVAEWFQAATANNGTARVSDAEINDTSKVIKKDVEISWSLDTNAPEAAQSSQIGFALGAELATTPPK
ncbi:hypothetical protein [Streptomyces sp. NPDC050485]|uniref:hypothetical protein n=1 Tax=Streptomyces sp. NPDC050485 TaxID=3365617 RepID=UPI0037A58094